MDKLISSILGIGFLLMPLLFSNYISDVFNSSKFILFYVLAFALIFIGSLLKSSRTIIFNKLIFYVLLLNVFIYFLFQFIYVDGSYRVVSYELLSLLIVFIFSSFAKQTNKNFISNIAILNFVSLLIIVTTILYHIFQGNNEAFDLFFGNRNHLAEFLGASIVIQSVMYFQNSSKFTFHKILLSYTIISAFYICIKTLCRSVLLSLIICILVYTFFEVFKNIRKNGKLKLNLGHYLLVILILSIGSFYSYRTYFSSTSEIAYVKRATTNLRLIRWENTWEMFKEHPLGVGPNNYEFSYLNYKDKKANDYEITENLLVKSPHNGYLELFSEYGVIFGIAFMTLILILVIDFFKLTSSLYFYFILFFCINAFFSFPMELPVSSYMIAIFAGAGISEIKPKLNEIKFKFVWLLRLILIPFGISTVIIILSTISSNLFEDKFNSKLFCELTPSIWRNCVDAGVQEISQGHFKESSEILGNHLKLYPNNFIAQRYYAFSLAKIGKTDEACKILNHYDQLFLGKSSIKEIKEKQCPKKQ